MELNNKQKAIINNPSKLKIVVAGAGTGKTTTLISAAESVKHNRIALITFTNESANEIYKRLSFVPAFIGTIHKFSLLLLVDLSTKYNFKLNLLRNHQVIKIIRRLMEEMYFNSDEIKECTEFILNKSAYLAEHLTPPSYFNDVEEEYIKYKRKIGLYDMTDTPLYLLEKMKMYDLNLNYTNLFVDEGQDLSPDQYELIIKLPIDNKFIIGDPAQSIYMFRGADGQVFDKFKEEGYSSFNLDDNYRSYQEILNYCNSGLNAVKGYGGRIYTRLDELLNKKPQVLCRSNLDVERVKEVYPYVSTIHAAKGLEYNNVLIISFPITSLEEKNIMYVAKTRAIKGLGIFTLKSFLNYLKK